MEQGFTPEIANMMVLMVNLIGVENLSRVDLSNSSEVFEIRKAQRDRNSFTTANFTFTDNSHASRILKSASDISQQFKVTHPPLLSAEIGRDILYYLQRTLGDEGAKRFCEQAYLALRHFGDFKGSLQWANLRTLCDLERHLQVGQPFIVEHYLGDIFVVNDPKGARVTYLDGPSMEVATYTTSTRPKNV